jgi:hypothetical protein
MSNKAAELAARLRQQWSGPMTEKEVAFLRDVQGFVEFSVRNGLNFSIVMNGLLHDLNEIGRDGFDLESALARGFRPKVAGYSKLSTDDFGGSDDSDSPGTEPLA